MRIAKYGKKLAMALVICGSLMAGVAYADSCPEGQHLHCISVFGHDVCYCISD